MGVCSERRVTTRPSCQLQGPLALVLLLTCILPAHGGSLPHHTRSPANPRAPPASGDMQAGPGTAASIEDVHLELLKKNLLQQLGLREPPTIMGPVRPPPEPLVRQVEEQNLHRLADLAEETEEQGSHRQQVIYARRSGQ